MGFLTAAKVLCSWGFIVRRKEATPVPTMVHIQPRGWVVILCSLWLGLQACAITGPPYPTPLPQTPDDDDRCPSPEVTLIEGQPRGLRLRLSIPSDDTNDDSESNSPTRNNPEGNRSKDPKKGDSEGNSSQNNPKTNSSSKHRSPKRGDAPCSPLGDQVALLRQVTRIDGSSTVFEPHATFKRDDAQSKALWTTGHLDILDGPLKPGFTYRYAAVGLDDEGTMVGKPSSPVGLTWVEAPEPPTALVADSGGQVRCIWWPTESEIGRAHV